jgi:hypothetical protein
MSNRLCVVEVASFYSGMDRRQWLRCFIGHNRTQCHEFIDQVVGQVVADNPLDSLLAQERARELFRLYSLRTEL